VDDDELTDYYDIDVVVDDIDYGDVDTTYGGSVVDDNPGWEEPEPIYVAVVEVVEVVEDFGEPFIEEVLEPEPPPVIEEVFEEVFEEEIFEEVYEEVVVIEEVFEEEEIFEEPEEIFEEVFAEEIEEVFEEELIVIAEVFEEEIEEEVEVVELEAPIEEVAVVEEEIVPEVEEPQRAAVDITKLALSIVAETSVIPTALAKSAVSQTQPLPSRDLNHTNRYLSVTQPLPEQTFTQGTFAITPTPEATFADTSFINETINATQTAALAEVGIVFDSGFSGFSGSVQLAQLGQTDIQQSMDTGGSTDVFGDTGSFEPEIEVIQDIVSSGPVQNFNQVVTQSSSEETPSEEVEVMQELSASVTEMKFEQDFNEAIATGQTIGQFLSQQAPDFGQFNVAPPSVDEARTVQRAETALQTMTDAEIEQSIESQLENVQDSGGFEDQTLTILLMSRVPGFDVYGVELQDQGQWYQEREIYGGNRPIDGNIRAFQGQGAQTFQELIQGQYDR
jgi:hypothetical protein